VSAEDELSWYPPNPQIAAWDASQYAEYWEDSESNDWNVRTIGWWLRQRVEEVDR
jgi:hypothetical protein